MDSDPKKQRKAAKLPFVKDSPSISPETASKKEGKKKRRTTEEWVQFYRQCAAFAASLRELQAAGIRPRVGKNQIVLVLGDGFSRAQVDRLRDPKDKYYDPNFPKPIDPEAYRLDWWFDELVEYDRNRLLKPRKRRSKQAA